MLLLVVMMVLLAVVVLLHVLMMPNRATPLTTPDVSAVPAAAVQFARGMEAMNLDDSGRGRCGRSATSSAERSSLRDSRK